VLARTDQLLVLRRDGALRKVGNDFDITSTSAANAATESTAKAAESTES